MSETLFYSPGACSLAVHLALVEANADFQLELVSTAQGMQRRPEYLEVNPKGRVPALSTANGVLTEVPALLFYVAARYPAAALSPRGEWATARALEWCNWLSGEVHGASFAQYWRPERFSDEEAARENVKVRGRQKIQQALEMIEARFASEAKPWILGAEYSLVDCYLLVFYRWGYRVGNDMVALFPAWSQWAQRMEERPAVGRVLSAEGIQLRA